SHIDKGLVSVTRSQGKRYVDVSELLRHYGDVSLPKDKVSDVTRSQDKQDIDTSQTLKAMQKELAELRMLVEGQQQLLLEDKQARDQQIQQQSTERQEQIELIEQLQQERDALSAALEAERGKGFWSRIFKKE
ncbi:MAG: hypothetical protein E7J78_08135, partial [Pantoea sp.]|nr:hypothetical protein [Pantoea sp.]